MLFSTHIPKTGGSTFASGVLRRIFDENVKMFDTETITGNPIRGRKIKPDGFRCIHGHYWPKIFRQYLGKAEFCVWVRDPVERALSHYNMLKRMYGFSFDVYCLDTRQHNVQTRYMDGMDFSDMDFVGVTDEYERSLNVFRMIYPKTPENPLPRRFNKWSKQSVNDKYEITDMQRAHLEELNQKDMIIYNQGKNRLAEIEQTLR